MNRAIDELAADVADDDRMRQVWLDAVVLQVTELAGDRERAPKKLRLPRKTRPVFVQGGHLLDRAARVAAA